MNKYDLQNRTLAVGKEILSLIQLVPQDVITRPLVCQLVRSATSIGANYMEANGASSERDFAHKLFLCKKEAQETEYWLARILDRCPDLSERLSSLQAEVHELILIFQAAGKTTRAKLKIGN